MSDSGTYMFCPSLADPHSMPPSAPPRPTVVLHSFLPPWSGSKPWTTPDFCPATITRLPPASVTRIGDWPKS